MELDYKAIGKRIKIARIKKNLTQEAIAAVGCIRSVKDCPTAYRLRLVP